MCLSWRAAAAYAGAMNSHLYRLMVLQPGQLLRLSVVGSQRLTVGQGRLWLTQSGSPVDHFLSAGQTLIVDAGRRPVVESDTAEPASLTLQPIGVTASLAAWIAAGREGLKDRLARAREMHGQRRRARQDRRLLLELDEHQLRDIGAPPQMLMAARALSRQRIDDQALPLALREPTWRL